MRFFLVLGLGVGLFAGLACEPSREPVRTTGAPLSGAPAVRAVAWGNGPDSLGYRAAVTERLALGPTSIAVDPQGRVLVLDAIHERIARLSESGVLAAIARVDRDSDDIAVGPDGAMAVRHSTTTTIDVLDPNGTRIGSLDSSMVRDVDLVSLGRSRQVSVTNAYQETFLLGSPSFPQSAEGVLHSKREGAAFLPDRSGLDVVRRADGVVELRSLAAPEGELDRTHVRARVEVGPATSARIVGTSASTACMRLEHVTDSASGIVVRREAVCVDLRSGRESLRVDLPAPGSYVPRRELVFASGTLAMLHPEATGARVLTWSVGGAR